MAPTQFHPQQIKVAGEIMMKFSLTPFIVLLAQMQSGKTGAYLYLAFEMIRVGMIDRVVIICGSSDTSLRKQTIQEKEDAIAPYVETSGISGMDVIKLFQSVTVYFSQSLKDVPEITERTLVIHDECHMAQSKNNIPFKTFYKRNNLDGALLGDFRSLKSKTNFILGVSATPFSEIVANRKFETDDYSDFERPLLKDIPIDAKYFHFMKPGDGYIGVPEFLQAGAIKFVAQTVKNEASHVSHVLIENREKYNNKYCIIRTKCADKDSDLVDAISRNCGYEYDYSFGGDTGIEEKLLIAPDSPTVLHICDRCRMGQVIGKSHVAMVYEQSSDPNADTILQGLVGRVCGYSSNLNIDIYVSELAKPHIEEYARAWSLGEARILSEFTKAMNLGPGRKGKGVVAKDKGETDIIAIRPIKFNIRDIERDNDGKKKIDALTIINLLEDNPDLIKDKQDKAVIMEQFRDLGDRSNSSVFFHRESKNEKNIVKLNEAYRNDRRLRIDLLGIDYAAGMTKQKLNATPEDYYLHEKPFIVYQVGNGDCYIGGWVPYREEVHDEEDNKPIATVDRKCNYIPGGVELEDGTVLEGVNGVQIITFTTGTSNDIDTFKSEIRTMINRTDNNHTTYDANASRSINSINDKKTGKPVGIRLMTSIYTEQVIKKIQKDLKQEISVNVKFKKVRGRKRAEDMGYDRYESISW